MGEQTRRPAREKASRRRTDLETVFSAEGVDLTAIRWMLSLTPLQRLEAAEDLIAAARALRSGNEM
jgi:hypothetical protein